MFARGDGWTARETRQLPSITAANASFCSKCTEDDWDGLRASSQEFLKIQGVKDEASDSDAEMLPDDSDSTNSIHVFENYCEKQSLVNPMSDDFLILNVARANIRQRASCKRSVRYYTSDYRRLWCMYDAGFRAVRVRVTRSARVWNEYFDYYYDSSLGDELCYVCTSTRTKEQCWCRFLPGRTERERGETRKE